MTKPETIVCYAGANNDRKEFVKHAVGTRATVITADGGAEPLALTPLYVAHEKVNHAKNHCSAGAKAFIAIDVMTCVPAMRQGGIVYEPLGKPKSEDDVQRVFWEMSRNSHPYIIRAGTIFEWDDSPTRCAVHSTEITVSPTGLDHLASDSGFHQYADMVQEFGQIMGPKSIGNISAGLHLESLLVCHFVSAIDGISINNPEFQPAMERAVFLAAVGASHKAFTDVSDDPMRDIRTFPTHQNRLSYIETFQK